MPARKHLGLVSRTVAAIQEGRLAVEQLIRGALASDGSFAPWLERRLATADTREPALPEIKHHARFPAEVVDRALAQAKRSLRRRGVVGVLWGVAHRKGLAHGEPAVVVLVAEKRARDRLRKSQLLPSQIRVRLGHRTFSVPVDVQRMSHGQKEKGDARPGRGALVELADSYGTVSAVIDRTAGPGVVVSGHVATRVGVAAQARLANGQEIAIGRVALRRDDQNVDAARIDGVSPGDMPFLASEGAELRDLSVDDLNIRLTVRRAQGDGDAFGYVAAVGERASFRDDDGIEHPMNGLIRLHAKVTRTGDSGAPVVDFRNALVGFVIGSANGHTYLIPARRALDAMR